MFAIGLNYADHAAEAGFALPEAPAVFTKFPSCIVGAGTEVPVVGPTTDWEVELVVVVGREAHHVASADAWSVIAGATIGQDITERAVQLAGQAPQFSLGKSFHAYGPTGPWLVTRDELEDVDDLGITCRVDDEVVQQGRTSSMIFPISQLVAGHHAQLGVLDGHEVLFVERLTAPQSVINITQVAGRLPLHASSSGLILLAFAPRVLQEQVLAGPLLPYTPETIVQPDRLRATLAEIRRTEHVVCPGYIHEDAAGVAVPVRDPQDRVVAALSVIVPNDPAAVSRVPILHAAARGVRREMSVAGDGVPPGSRP